SRRRPRPSRPPPCAPDHPPAAAAPRSVANPRAGCRQTRGRPRQWLQRAPVLEMRWIQRAWAADANHRSWPAFSGFTRVGHARLRFNMSRNSGLVKDRRAWYLPAATRRRRRRFRRALPDRPVIELNGHAVRGIDRAEIGPGNPKAAGIVHPASGWLPASLDQLALPTVLRDEGEARPSRYAPRDAPIWAGQIHALRRRVGRDRSCRHGNRTQDHSHRFLLNY